MDIQLVRELVKTKTARELTTYLTSGQPFDPPAAGGQQAAFDLAALLKPVEHADEYAMALRIRSYNDAQGELEGLQCDLCKNKGNIMVITENGTEGLVECPCAKRRRSILRAQRSGMGELLNKTLDNFDTAQPWQQTLLNGAKHYLAQDVLIDLIVDTGDLNYDFTSNIIGGHYNASDDSIQEEASLLWLARQQGYKKSELKKALADRGNSQSPLLKSIYRETLNCGSHMNALAFLVKMTLEEYFTLRDGIDKERERNKSYYLSERTGRGYLLLSKDTTCGLYDSWNGSGSVLEIKLEKDVRLPFRCIASADHDGCHGYGIREIYGCGSDLWSDNAVKLIRPMKKAA